MITHRLQMEHLVKNRMISDSIMAMNWRSGEDAEGFGSEVPSFGLGEAGNQQGFFDWIQCSNPLAHVIIQPLRFFSEVLLFFGEESGCCKQRIISE